MKPKQMEYMASEIWIIVIAYEEYGLRIGKVNRISDGPFSNSSLNMAICFEIGLCLYWAGSGLHGLTSQTHFTKTLMNCVHKLCLTGLPLAQ